MKNSVRVAVIAVLATLAVAFAAATLDSVTRTGGSSSAGFGGSGDRGLLPPPRSSSAPGETLHIPIPSEILTFLGVIAALAIVVYVIVYRQEALRIALVGAALLGFLFVLAQILPSLIDLSAEPGIDNGSILGGNGENGETVEPSRPPLVLLFVLSFLLAGAIVALVRTTGGESEESSRDSEDRETNIAAVGRIAGQAADSIDQETDVGNEVYRAWREMTDLLDVADPETNTPGEFATAAVEAGLGREDVNELTRLFEDVRYGDADPSEECERQAVTIFRRIETRYAEDSS